MVRLITAAFSGADLLEGRAFQMGVLILSANGAAIIRR